MSSGYAYGFVADGELQTVPDEQVEAAARAVRRLVPAEDRPSIAAMLGVPA